MVVLFDLETSSFSAQMLQSGSQEKQQYGVECIASNFDEIFPMKSRSEVKSVRVVFTAGASCGGNHIGNGDRALQVPRY